MANLLIESETEQSRETRVVHVAERAIPFDRFLAMAEGRFVELVDGVIVDKPMIQLDHERCSRWLYQVAGMYVQRSGLGEFLCSRIMVRTDAFGGRMPDLLFVSRDRIDIIQQKAVYGAPDLVIEIVLPGDRPSDLRALEADYFKLGVPELVFIHLQKQEVRIMRRRDDAYDETVILDGPLTFDSLPGLTLQVSWLLRDPRPDGFDILSSIFAA